MDGMPQNPATHISNMIKRGGKVKRRSGLNFSRRRKKFNVPLFKEIMTWVLECAIVIAIAYALVSSFGFRTKYENFFHFKKRTEKNRKQVKILYRGTG